MVDIMSVMLIDASTVQKECTHYIFYAIQGVVNTNATKKDMSDTYDYVVDDKDNGALYEDTEPYHSMGPDVSLSSMETSNGRSTLTKNGHISNIYEAPVTQRFRVSEIGNC